MCHRGLLPGVQGHLVLAHVTGEVEGLVAAMWGSLLLQPLVLANLALAIAGYECDATSQTVQFPPSSLSCTVVPFPGTPFQK